MVGVCNRPCVCFGLPKRICRSSRPGITDWTLSCSANSYGHRPIESSVLTTPRIRGRPGPHQNWSSCSRRRGWLAASEHRLPVCGPSGHVVRCCYCCVTAVAAAACYKHGGPTGNMPMFRLSSREKQFGTSNRKNDRQKDGNGADGKMFAAQMRTDAAADNRRNCEEKS
jgi:hypothetical protein